MNYIEPKLVRMDSFTVSGLNVRTINRDEFNPEKAKLSDLWRRFSSEGMVEKIPNKQLNSPVFGVYSDYDSDETGFYTVTAGVIVNPPLVVPAFSMVSVTAGEYLVFEGKGGMPQAVVDAWQRVWDYFAQQSDYKRNYNTDFEAYQGSDAVAIYIGIVGSEA